MFQTRWDWGRLLADCWIWSDQKILYFFYFYFRPYFFPCFVFFTNNKFAGVYFLFQFWILLLPLYLLWPTAREISMYLSWIWNETHRHRINRQQYPATIISSLLKVDVQFQIMTFLSPADICRLGATSQYWRAMVRDPLLWRYFLLRDMPHWPSIDHLSMPQLDAPLISEEESVDDREEGEDKGMESKFDYMSEWVSFPVVMLHSSP